MKIRTRLLLSHGLVALVVGCICGVILLVLNASDGSRKSLEKSYENLRAINELNSDANRMSEQIAELFAVGGAGLAEMNEAQAILLRRIDVLRADLQGEMAQTALAERETMYALLGWTEDLAEAAVSVRAVGNQVAALLAEGRVADAQRLYARQLEDGLDTRIADLIAEALDRNARSVQMEIAASNRLTENQRLLAISIVLASTMMAVGLALLMDKSVSRPLMALTDAADHLAAGDREITLDTRRRDELGELAERFQQMAQRIGAQQASLRAARDSLAAQVAERTESLSQRTEELEIANARLRELDSTRTRFLADISHELRTPLTVIRGQAEVAMRAQDPSPALLLAAMEAMLRKTGELGRLVDDLLFIARSEAGTVRITPEPVRLQDILAEVTRDASMLRAGDGIRIALDQPPGPVMVDADPVRIHQAVMIVLDNAVQHSPEGGVVRVGLTRDGTQARLTVADLGEGFHEADIPHVFDRFYRGRGSRDGKGSGLGLAIAAWIVTRHGGRISIDRHQDGTKGAVIQIALPLTQPRLGTAA